MYTFPTYTVYVNYVRKPKQLHTIYIYINPRVFYNDFYVHALLSNHVQYMYAYFNPNGVVYAPDQNVCLTCYITWGICIYMYTILHTIPFLHT